MSLLVGALGFLAMVAGIITGIIFWIIKKPSKTGGKIFVVGFLLFILSIFPKDILFGLGGFIAFVAGIIMLVIALSKEKPVKIPLTLLIVGGISFFSTLSTSSNTPVTETSTVAESTEVEEIEENAKEEVVAEEEEIPEEPIEEVIGIGDKFAVENVYYTINEISTSQNVGGKYGKEAKSQYTIINLTVQNEQNEAIRVDSDQFTLLSGKRTYESDGGAAIYANDDHDFFYTEVNPGVTLTGNIVFDVPAGLKNLQLHVQTDLWGSEIGVVNLQ